MWRCTGRRNVAWPTTTPGSAAAAHTWRRGRRPRPRWPRTCLPETTTRGRARRRCCAGRWPRCPHRPGPDGWGCAPMAGTSPVKSYSNLIMHVDATPTVVAAGAPVTLVASLTEDDAPLTGRATVQVEAQDPLGGVTLLPLPEITAGTAQG